MKVIRFDNEGIANRTEYITDETDIRDIAAKFGHARDTVELYDENDILVARAIWPMGSKVYMYSYGENLDPNPIFCHYIY